MIGRSNLVKSKWNVNSWRVDMGDMLNHFKILQSYISNLIILKKIRNIIGLR